MSGPLVIDNDVHVLLIQSASARVRPWWVARSKAGDWGISVNKEKVIKLACQVVTDSPFHAQQVVVHDSRHKVLYTITKVRGLTPSSQAFQDL